MTNKLSNLNNENLINSFFNLCKFNRFISLNSCCFISSSYLLLFLLFLLALTSSQCKAQEAKPLIAVIPADFPPTYFKDAHTGEPAGLAIDVTNEIAKLGGIKVEYRFAKAWDEIEQMLFNGEADMIPFRVMNDKTVKKFIFTRSLDTNAINYVIRSTGKSITSPAPGMNVGVIKGSSAQEYFKDRKDINLMLYESLQNMLLELLAGQVDIVLTATPNILRLAEDAGLEDRIKIIQPPVIEGKRGIALNPSNSALLERLESAIEKFEKSPKAKQIYEKWLGKPKPYWNTHRIVVLMCFIFSVFTVLLIIWRFASMHNLNKKLISEKQFLQIMIDSIPDFIFYKNSQSVYLGCNKTFASSLIGIPKEEIIGKTDLDIIQDKEMAEFFRRKDRESLEAGSLRINEESLVLRNGKKIYLETVKVPFFDVNGNIEGIIGIAHDISVRKLAVDTLNFQYELMKHLSSLESIDDILKTCLDAVIRISGLDCGGIYLLDEKTKILYLKAHFGLSQTFIEKASYITPDYPNYSLVIEGKPIYSTAGKLSSPGRVLHEHLQFIALIPIFHNHKPIACLNIGSHTSDSIQENVKVSLETIAGQVGIFIARALMDKELQESEALYRILLESMNIGIVIIDTKTRKIDFVNNTAASMFGETRQQIEGKICYQSLCPNNEEKCPVLDLNQKIDSADRVMLCSDGSRIPILKSVKRIMIKGEEKLLESFIDISARKKAEEDYKLEAERRSILMERCGDGIAIINQEHKVVEANKKFADMLGYTQEEVINLHTWDWDLSMNEEEIRKNFSDLKTINVTFETRHRRKNGTEYDVEVSASGALVGNESMVFTISRDISERKQAEKEKEILQSQLMQSQKIESIGRLAGGVAHDFNNMLQAILGNLEIAMYEVLPDTDLFKNLEEVNMAAKRSAELTRQLLAFARKQTVAPKILDLNETVSGMLKMLKRLIGEDINLDWIPAQDLWPIRIDPSQIDQILANLCVNARDAIHGVGKIIIGTNNTSFDENDCIGQTGLIPGDFVMLTVSDDGRGMEKEELEHLFEPFFTTKGIGHGTGLGLATVYGIVKQNEGFISVYTEPGKGTTMKIYLPRFLGKSPEIQSEQIIETRKSKGETILLVEDEISILNLAKRFLERLNYIVLPATSPDEAIQYAKDRGNKISLLVSDVVMPEMNGRELAEMVKKIIPDIKCLFMSGYTSDVIAHRGMLDDGVLFIQKPFSFKKFIDKVREAIEK